MIYGTDKVNGDGNLMKRIISCLIVTAMLFVAFSAVAFAQVTVDTKKSGKEGIFSYVENDDGTIRIEMTDTTASGVVTVPDKIGKKKVTQISTYAFWDCVNITEVNIGSNIVQIGQMAFMNCPSLQKINVDENNEYYASMAGILSDKSYTTIIKCPAQMTGDFVMPDTIKTIAQYSFFDCAKMTSIKLSSKLSNIPSFAFANCSSLTEMQIPSTVTDIGESAFSYCTKLENITVPDEVFYLGASAFANCSSLKKVHIGAALVFIGDLVFTGCNALTEFSVSAMNTMYSAKDGMLLSKNGKTFYACPQAKAEEITLPDGVQKIAKYAFYSFKNIEGITMPETLEEIADFAFVSCQVDSIMFKGEAPELGKNVFYDASPNLTIYCYEKNKTSFASSAWRDLNVQTVKDEEEEQANIGDLNGDGKINSRDLAQLQRYIVGEAPLAGTIEFLTADVTEDGKVNSRDIAALQRIVAS